MVLAMLCGCSSRKLFQTGTAVDLNDAAVRLSEIAGKPLRPYAAYDFGREQNSAARSVLVDEEDAPTVLAKIRSELAPGLLAFIGCTRSLAEPSDDGWEIVVATGQNQFDILRIAQSDAANYDMETDDIIRKLEEFDLKFGIDIFHAESDTIEFEFKQLPENLMAFSQDLYEFCPDIVDQGLETVENLENEIAVTGRVFLWWD